jgi:hypothetical protein
MECLQAQNKENCNCSYPCEKQGLCCKCISYHRNRGELPACYFSEEDERTYDRTIENFIRINQEKR